MNGPFTSIDRSYVGLPPWVEPPKDARMVDSTDQVTATPGVEAVVLSFKVESGKTLHIHGVGTGCKDAMGVMLGQWSLKNGDYEIEGYHYLPCALGSLDQPKRVSVTLRGPATLNIVVLNNAYVTTYTYVATIWGWIYQPDDREVQ